MKRTYFSFAGVIVVAALLLGLALYPSLPDRVPVHWNAQGVADGYGPKLQAVLLLPGIMAAITLLFATLPWLSPRHFEVNDGRPAYLQIMLVLLVAMVGLQGVTLSAALGQHFDMARAVLAGICLMFAGMAIFLPGLPRNFYVGVRTPWTLADERVWQATHRFAARTFLFGGLAGIAFALLPRPHAAMVALGAGALAPVVHSLVYYKHLEHKGQL